MQIIPAILAESEDEFRLKAERVRALGLPVQIDVCDGQFVPTKTWAVPERVGKILRDIPFEAHLMVANPEHLVPVWLAAGAFRVYYHAESTHVDDYILRSVTPDDGKVGIALNPETPISRIVHALDAMHFVLIMGVVPGKSGREFQPIALEKIAAIKRIRPSVTVAVDGGVNLATIRAVRDAGADMVDVGSALTDATDPVAALAALNKALE